jgi:hypothetical protein
MSRIMLVQQVFAVVVAVGRANHRMDVLARGLCAPATAQVGGALVVELDQHDGAVDAIVKDAVGIDAADPSEVSRLKMAFYFVIFILA